MRIRFGVLRRGSPGEAEGCEDENERRTMSTRRFEIPLSTSRRFELLDITAEVRKGVAASGVRDGVAIVFSPHTTAAIRVNEKEERLHQDLEGFLAELADPRSAFRHNAETVDGRPNAWGHLVSFLMGSSAAIPVSNGDLELGGWQAVFFVELDGPRESRKAVVKIVGD
jgi:secondary thiamine-phosphate synthase enzyme